MNKEIHNMNIQSYLFWYKCIKSVIYWNYKTKQIQFVQFIDSIITIDDYYYIHEDVILNNITCLCFNSECTKYKRVFNYSYSTIINSNTKNSYEQDEEKIFIINTNE